MAPKRLEITVGEDVLARLDEARGFEPRASFVKRALEAALGEAEDLAAAVAGIPAALERSRRAGPLPGVEPLVRAPVEKEPVESEADLRAREHAQYLGPPLVRPSSRRVSPDVVRRQAALNKAKEKS